MCASKGADPCPFPPYLICRVQKRWNSRPPGKRVWGVLDVHSSYCPPIEIDTMLWLYTDDPGAHADFRAPRLLARAVELRHAPLCRLLLERGADPAEQNHLRKSLLEVWLQHPDRDTLEVLRTQCNVSQKEIEQVCKTAVQNQWHSCAKALIRHCSFPPDYWASLRDFGCIHRDEIAAFQLFWAIFNSIICLSTKYHYLEQTFFATGRWADACTAYADFSSMLYWNPTILSGRDVQRCFENLLHRNISVTSLTPLNGMPECGMLWLTYVKRNRGIRRMIRHTVLLLMWATPDSPFGRLPRELRRLIAQQVWGTRFDAAIWRKIAPQDVEPISYLEYGGVLVSEGAKRLVNYLGKM